MKPDYKNWVPRGLLFLLGGAAGVCLAACAVFGIAGVAADGGLNVAMPESYDATGTAGQTEHENYLKLFANLSTYCFKISGLTVKTGDWSQTFNFTYDTPKSENGTAFTCSNSLEPVLLNDLAGA